MRARLFETLIVSRTAGAGARTHLAIPVSMTVHALGVAALLGIPFWTAAALPELHQPPIGRPSGPPIVRLAPEPTPAPAPHVTHRSESTPSTTRPRRPSIAVPRHAPDGLPAPDSGTDPDPRAALVDGAACPECTAPFGRDSVDIGGPGSGDGDPKGTLVVLSERDVRAPRKLRNVPPRYPELALRAGVQGRVVIECTIDTNGRIANARLVSGHALLDAAALEAVVQWVYTPTLLDGVPVAVLMTVTVNFNLTR